MEAIVFILASVSLTLFVGMSIGQAVATDKKNKK